MPIYSFSQYASTSFCLIWSIEESLEELYSQLPDQFLANFNSSCISSKDRIRQSLAVRVTLCHLLQKLCLPIFILSKNEQGKPVLEGSILHISFSHTRYLAAVALSTSIPIGIDIEMVNSSLSRVQTRFLTEEEVRSANYCLEKLIIYWSAKEALYKRLDRQQFFTFKDIVIEPFQLQARGKVTAYIHQRKYEMGYQRIIDTALQPHVLVCCQD